MPAESAVAEILAAIDALVECGHARRRVGDGRVELRLRTGEIFLLGDTGVRRLPDATVTGVQPLVARPLRGA